MRTWLKRLLIAVPVLVLALVLAVWWLLRGSLPTLDGELALPGLSAPAKIERDALGVVTIEAANESDALRALGYVHAQERYFEMDLMRRTSAGELSELFGPIALDLDKRHRTHRMRARVTEHLDVVVGNRAPQLQAYTDGVNAGLAAQRVRPWPYLLLRQSPRPWLVTDTALAGYAMYFDLQDSTNARELALWRLQPHLPPALFGLLTHRGSRWDAPLVGEAFGDAVLPGANEVDLRTLPVPETADLGGVLRSRDKAPLVALGLSLAAHESGHAPGSNNFAVSGALTADGRAIVADDMHLGLRAPNIWFRARLRYPDAEAPGGQVDVQGVTLPGLPLVVVGSNGHVAWGYTNSYGDYLDWARETPCDDQAGDSTLSCTTVNVHRERILVAGGEPVVFEVRETRWGPILHDQPDGKVLSLRWTAHLPGSVNLGLMGFAKVADLDAALALADRTAIPTQNLVIGDSKGNVAWRLLGRLPARSSDCHATDLIVDAPTVQTTLASGAFPKDAPSSTERHACEPWPIATDQSPDAQSPSIDRLWTANARVVSGEALARIGDGGYDLGARAQQIRDDLRAKERFSESDLLAIQLDDRALLLTHWWELLRSLPRDDASPALRELADAAGDWQGRASIDSTSYRLVRAWRLAVHARLLDGLLAPARAAMGDAFATPDLPQFEGVAWPLVQQRPAHLLPARFDSWQALFEDAARDVRNDLAPLGPLRERTWGERNTARICHPLAGAIPWLGTRALCMPAEPLPGDGMMARVQAPSFGASERMVVSPGHEADGILHMPGGQSGHPLSPFWGAGHDDWVHGRPTPFLPGPAVHALVLHP